jgi:curli production assembly/transport component CsgF
MWKSIGLVCISFILCMKVEAQQLVYTPVNPSFGGSPLNSSHLLGTAAAQNRFTQSSDQSTAQLSGAEQFVQMLESQLYSSLAQSVSTQIFGSSAPASGTIEFSNQRINFQNTGTQVNVTVYDLITGKTTQISVPVMTQ